MDRDDVLKLAKEAGHPMPEADAAFFERFIELLASKQAQQEPVSGAVGELPPLPHTTYNAYSDGSEPLYTAEQMQDYARAALQPAQTAPSQDGEAAALRQKLANSEYVKRMKDDLIAHLRAQISTARADGFAQCKEMAKTELRKERDASKDYEGVSLAYNGALSLINALQCPEQPASQQPSETAIHNAAIKAAANVCDAKFEAREKSGHPREASTARALASEIRSLLRPAAQEAEKPSAPTDISKRLRQYGVSGDVSDGALLIQAADEIERYYGGMLAWKATAEAKDREAAREQPAAPSEDKPVDEPWCVSEGRKLRAKMVVKPEADPEPAAQSNPPHEGWMNGFSARRLITDGGFDGYELVVHGRRFTPYPNEFEYLLMLMQSAVDKPAAQSDNKGALDVIGYVCVADIPAITEAGVDLSIAAKPLPRYGMTEPVYALRAAPTDGKDTVRRALVWSEPASPNDAIPYDHVAAQTPFGRILITWKSWKENPGFSINEHPMEATVYWSGCSLESTKEEAENQYFAAIHTALAQQAVKEQGNG